MAASVEAEEVARIAVPARRGRPELALGTIGGTIVHFAALNAGVIALVKLLELGHDTTRFYLPVATLPAPRSWRPCYSSGSDSAGPKALC